jgi:hypothetical protein
MSETCTIEDVETTVDFGLIRHGLSVELMLMGVVDLTIIEREYDLYKLLEDRYPKNPYFLRPVRCDADGAFYRNYSILSLSKARTALLERYQDNQQKRDELAIQSTQAVENVDDTVNFNSTTENIDSDPVTVSSNPDENIFVGSTGNIGLTGNVGPTGNVESGECQLKESLPHHQLWTYVIEIAEAMKLLHEAGIIHRNLSVSTVGASDHIVISDLISAARYSESGVIPESPPMFAGAIYTETSEYKIVGSSSIHKYYTAPEARNDPTKFSPASDMYSFGVLVHDLVTGIYPVNVDGNFDPDQMDHLIQAFNKEYPDREFPAVNLSHIEEFKSLITDCLRTEPEERPRFDDTLLSRLNVVGEIIKNQPLEWWIKISEKSAVERSVSKDICQLL